MKPHKKLTLNSCTRDDLIWIINRLLQMTCFDRGEYYIGKALRELQYEKEKRAYEEAEKVSEKAGKKWQEYLDILKPYDGKSYLNIPTEILEKAEKIYNDAIALDKKWNKIMGLED